MGLLLSWRTWRGMADPHCTDRGIPDHLHHEDRPLVEFDAARELLFRRFNLQNEATITACIKFKEMSVNRERLSAPDDALFNTEDGGRYEDHGVVEFAVESLRAPTEDGCWRLDNVPGAYELRPVHKPGRCNYAHSEVLVFKDGQPQGNIKPTTMKLAIRRDLEPRIKVRLPVEQAGGQLPLGE